MIFDEAGNLVWFSPLPRGIAAENLQVEQLGGEPVLTYWRGRIPAQGFGEGLGAHFRDSFSISKWTGQASQNMLLFSTIGLGRLDTI